MNPVTTQRGEAGTVACLIHTCNTCHSALASGQPSAQVDLSVEKHSFHLLVDNLRVTDGQLPAGEGAALNLSSPVYLGADLTTPNTEAQVPLSLPVYLGADLTSPLHRSTGTS